MVDQLATRNNFKRTLSLFVVAFIGRPSVKRFALCYGSVVLSVFLFCLSVCDVGVLWQTAGRIKTKLGMEVGLGPGHTVLDGDPPPLP